MSFSVSPFDSGCKMLAESGGGKQAVRPLEVSPPPMSSATALGLCSPRGRGLC